MQSLLTIMQPLAYELRRCNFLANRVNQVELRIFKIRLISTIATHDARVLQTASWCAAIVPIKLINMQIRPISRSFMDIWAQRL